MLLLNSGKGVGHARELQKGDDGIRVQWTPQLAALLSQRA